MLFEDLCLGRAWAVGVFAFITSPCAWAADRLFAIASLMIVSVDWLSNFLYKPSSVS